MEKENLELARKRGYMAVFTTNTSGLTQVCAAMFQRFRLQAKGNSL